MIILKIQSLDSILIPQINVQVQQNNNNKQIDQQQIVNFNSYNPTQKNHIINPLIEKIGSILLNSESLHEEKQFFDKKEDKNQNTFSVVIQFKEKFIDEQISILVLLEVFFYWYILYPKNENEYQSFNFESDDQQTKKPKEEEKQEERKSIKRKLSNDLLNFVLKTKKSQQQTQNSKKGKCMTCQQCQGVLIKTDGPYKYLQQGWICNICDSTFSFNEGNMHCKPCTFDICMPCYEKACIHLSKTNILENLKKKYPKTIQIEKNMTEQEIEKIKKENKFIIIMQNFIQEIENVMKQIHENDFIIVKDNLTEQQTNEFKQLIDLSCKNKLQPISLKYFELDPEQMKRLDPLIIKLDEEEQQTLQTVGTTSMIKLETHLSSKKKDKPIDKELEKNVNALMDFGFTEKQARVALKDSKNNVDIAANSLLAGLYEAILDDEDDINPPEQISYLSRSNSQKSLKSDKSSNSKSKKKSSDQKSSGFLDIDELNESKESLLQSINLIVCKDQLAKHIQNVNKNQDKQKDYQEILFQKTGESQALIQQLYIETVRLLINNDKEYQQIFIQQLQQQLDIFINSLKNKQNSLDKQNLMILIGSFLIISSWPQKFTKFQRANVKDFLQNDYKKFYIYGYSEGLNTCDIISTKHKDITFENIDLSSVEQIESVEYNNDIPQDIQIKIFIFLEQLLVNKIKADRYDTITNHLSKAFIEQDYIEGGLNKANNFNKTNLFINSIFRMLQKEKINLNYLDKTHMESKLNLLSILEIIVNQSQNYVDENMNNLNSQLAESWQNLLSCSTYKETMTLIKQIDSSNCHNLILLEYIKFNNENNSNNYISHYDEDQYDDNNVLQPNINNFFESTIQTNQISNYITSLPEPFINQEGNKIIKIIEKQKFIWKLFREDFDKIRLKNSLIYDDKVQVINILYEILNPMDKNPGKKSFYEKKNEIAKKIKTTYQDKELSEILQHINEPFTSQYYLSQDLKIGNVYLVKSKRFNNQTNNYFKMTSQKFIPVVLLWVQGQSALIQFLDNDNCNQIVTWIEIRDSFKILEQNQTQILKLSHNLPISILQEQFDKMLEKNINVQSKKILNNYYSQNISNKIDYFKNNMSIIPQLIQRILKEELLDNTLESWQNLAGNQIIPYKSYDQAINLNYNSNSQINVYPKLNKVDKLLDKIIRDLNNQEQVIQLFNKQKQNLKEIIQHISQNGISKDLQIMNPETNLNNFPKFQNTENTSIFINFYKQAQMCITSQLNFYDHIDIDNNKPVQYIHVGLDKSLKVLPNINIQGKNIYTKFSFFRDNLPIYRDDLVISNNLECIIYGIPQAWNQICWLLDVMTSKFSFQSENQQYLQELSKFNSFLSEQLIILDQKGPVLLKQQIINLIIRTTKKIQYLVYHMRTKKIQNLKKFHWEILGISIKQIEICIKEIQNIKIQELKEQNNQQQLLCSTYIQDYIEMVAILLNPLVQKINKEPFSYNHRDVVYNQIPDYIEQVTNISIIFKFLSKQGILTSQLYQQTVDSQSQWANMICIDNLPTDIKVQDLKKMIIKMMHMSNRRIINPSTDIIIPCTEMSSQKIRKYFGQEGAYKQLSNQGICLILTDGSYISEQNEESKEQELSSLQEEKEIVEEMFSDKTQCQNCNQQMKNRCYSCEKLIKLVSKNFPQSNIILGRQIMQNQTALTHLQKILNNRLVEVPQKLQEYIQYLPYFTPQKLNKQTIQILKNVYPNLQKSEYLRTQIKRCVPDLDFSKFENFVESFQKFVLNTTNSMIIFYVLSDLGYNLWFVESTFDLNTSPRITNIPLIEQIINNQQDVKYLYDNTQQDVKEIRFTKNLLRVLNINFEKIFEYINIDKQTSSMLNILNSQKYNELNILDLKISNQILQYRELIIKNTKFDMQQKILKQTAIKDLSGFTMSLPYVYIDKNKEIPQFIQAFQSLKDQPKNQMRPIKSNDKGVPFVCFEIITQTTAQGAGGLYRQFYNDISLELKNENLGTALNFVALLKLNVEKREEFTINEKADTTLHLQLFEFLGVLMGCGIRTNTPLSINLPLIFWKQLVSQEIIKDDWINAQIKKDNGEIDNIFDETLINQIKELYESDNDIIDPQYISYFEYQVQQINEMYTNLENFKGATVPNINKSIIKNNKKFQIKYKKDLDLLIPLYCQSILQKTNIQITYIKKGIHSIVPEPLLKTISAKDLQILVCGMHIIDIDLLKKNTVYDGLDTDGSKLSVKSKRVQLLWDVLKSYKQEDRRKFIQFCYAVDRLPMTDDEYKQQGIVFKISANTSKLALSNPDQCYASSQTCFFQLKLPDYSSIEVLKNQLKLSIIGSGNELSE